MDATTVIAVSIGLVFVCLAWGVHIGIALGLPGAIGIAMIAGRPEAGLNTTFLVSLSVTSEYGFIVIPMFILMGHLAAATGIATDLFNAAYRWVGRFPGGLAVATIVTCAGMAAITGSGVAVASAMTRIALPEMRKYNYQDILSVGAVTVGGTLAIMIPPSVTFVLYSIFAEQSIGKLLISGIVPGLLTAGLYIICIVTRTLLQPSLAPKGPTFSWRDKAGSLPWVGPFAGIILTIIVGLLLGIWTPVEASAAGVVAVMVLGLVRRTLTARAILAAGVETAITSGSVMVVVIGAIIFSKFLALSGFNKALAEYVIGLDLSPHVLFSLLVLIYIILGMFLEATSILALTVPLFLPVVVAVGWSPIWFGVILVSLMEIAAVTPPVGLNLYAVKAGAPDVSIETISLASLPFWLCNIVAIYLMYLWPDMALWLPGLM